MYITTYKKFQTEYAFLKMQHYCLLSVCLAQFRNIPTAKKANRNFNKYTVYRENIARLTSQ